MSRSQYRIALYDESGDVIQGARYMHVSDETPTPGLTIDLPHGRWFVHQVVADRNEDPSSRLIGANPPAAGTLMCRPSPPADLR
jgi:hypothetical protein